MAVSPPKLHSTVASLLDDNVCSAIGSFLPDGKLLYVKTLTGYVTQVRWRYERTTILELKEKLRRITGIPADQQRLCFAGEQLKDNHTLGKITSNEDDCTFHMVLRLRGGARTKQTARMSSAEYAAYKDRKKRAREQATKAKRGRKKRRKSGEGSDDEGGK